MMIHLAHAMHGVGIPLGLHIGVKNIIVIGWDGLLPGTKGSHFYRGGKADRSEYGSKAIVECNKHTTKFLKERFGVNLYQINTKSLYKEIPQITVDQFIKDGF